MLKTVIIINLLIGGLCFYLVGQLKRITRFLWQSEKNLIIMERKSRNWFDRTSKFFLKRKKMVSHLNDRYNRLAWQVEKLQSWLWLLSLGQKLLERPGFFQKSGLLTKKNSNLIQ